MAKPKAQHFDACLIGADAATYLCALDIARYGFRVVVCEPAEAFIPEEFVHAGGEVAALCDELNVGYDIDELGEEDLSVAGIPGNPFSPRVRAALGWRGSWRVYLDRLRPMLAIGNEHNLAKLARARLGAAAVTELVEPELHRLYGIDSANVDVNEVAPGLSQAVSRVGALTSGVFELIAGDECWKQRVRVAGGTATLVNALRSRLDYFAVTRIPLEKAQRVEATVTIDDVLARAESPAWERQIARARLRAELVRSDLLSDPEKPPIGPVDLEH